MLHGRHLKNGSKHLILVFQPVKKEVLEVVSEVLSGSANHEQIKKAHERYSWLNFATDYKESDYLFVQDYFSESFGWYLFDSGKVIYEELNKELEQFIERMGYEKITAFGSSKGGTGALVYGILNKYVTDVFALVPQVKVSTFINKYHRHEKKAFYRGNERLEQEIDQFFFDEKHYSNETMKNTNFYLYTGKNDMQFKDVLALKDLLQKHDIRTVLIVNTSKKTHSPLVIEHTDFVYGTLQDINENRALQNRELTRLNDDAYLLFA
ncbi:hypothetical protein HCA55_03880 [Listeria booriae]|uniref:Uncharacterized protein n=1 Tax=Listeria booriae TaxID=1552123 RepID=A0A842B0F8_9LIST|nr:hypothetical protein [Listeria booriae]MBC1795849.1 hypothetical protein [Listeria booriae]MBC1813651.1 hypothetical protein [Listeria booriae]